MRVHDSKAELHAVAERLEPVERAGADDDRATFLENCTQALEETFGFQSFRPGQEAALAALGNGRDTLVIMPTGSGKSLCYQVPALVLPGVTLVVSPLIALMKDQVDGLQLRGVRATFINSSLELEEQWRRLEGLRAGEHDLVYIAPERFRSRAFSRALAEANVSCLAVDEAHCISQWGHDFRPDYRRLRAVRERLEGVPVIALTATATPAVQEDIARELEMTCAERIVTGFDRPNLSLRVRPVRGSQRKLQELRQTILERFDAVEEGETPAGIIYTGTRKHAEEVAGFLASEDWPTSEDVDGPLCRAYHAGLEPDDRRTVQEDFMEGRLPWVAATNAFGMGVDKADIRFVVHYELPGSIEAYYQEVGRAGRDGLPSSCVLLFSEADRRLQEFFIEGGNPSRQAIEGVHEFLWTLGENPIHRSLAELHEGFDVRYMGLLPNGMAFRSSIVVLERAGALERLDHFDNLAEVTPNPDRLWTANPYRENAPVRRRLWEALQRVFERSDGDSAPIHLEGWARELELTLNSLRRGLVELVDDEWIDYLPPFRGRAIRLPAKRRSLGELGVDFEALAEKRRREEARLEGMVSYARSGSCRRDLILEHFGERVPREPCRQCDACREDKERPQLDTPPRPLSDGEFLDVRKVLSGVARVRGRFGRQRVVQMLLGSKARAICGSGLEQLSTYGILRHLRRADVHTYLDALEEIGATRATRERYPRILLTPRGHDVMLERERPELPLPSRSAPGSRAYATTEDDVGDYDEDLFQRLRHARREIAAELEVPAFRVFNDRTLKAMARDKPETPASLLALPGVGEATLERFGRRFLDEIRMHGADGESPG